MPVGISFRSNGLNVTASLRFARKSIPAALGVEYCGKSLLDLFIILTVTLSIIIAFLIVEY